MIYRVDWRPAPCDMMGSRLVTSSTLKLPENDEGEENDDQEDDGDSDAHHDGRVVWVRADGLRPGCLAIFATTRVSSNLNRGIMMTGYSHTNTSLISP